MQCYLHLFRFPDAAVRVDVGDVDGGVPLVAADAAPDPHAERLPRVLADGHGLLRQLRPLYPQRGLQKLRHLVVHVVIRHHRRRAWKCCENLELAKRAIFLIIPSIRKCQESVIKWSDVNQKFKCVSVQLSTWQRLGDGLAVLLVVGARLGAVSPLLPRHLGLRHAVRRHGLRRRQAERLDRGRGRLEFLHAGAPSLHLLYLNIFTVVVNIFLALNSGLPVAHLLPLAVDGLVDGHVVLALGQVVEGLVDDAVGAAVVEVVVPDRLLAPVAEVASAPAAAILLVLVVVAVPRADTLEVRG